MVFYIKKMYLFLIYIVLLEKICFGIWFYNNFINKMIYTTHLYIDGTFITTKDYKQLNIIIFFEQLSNKKIPDTFILINNKKEIDFTKALEAIKRLLSLEDSRIKSIKSITSYFEVGLINAIKSIFTKICRMSIP